MFFKKTNKKLIRFIDVYKYNLRIELKCTLVVTV